MITIKYTHTSKNFNIYNSGNGIYDLDILQDELGVTIKNSHFVCPPFFVKRLKGFTILTTNPNLKINNNLIFNPSINIKHKTWLIEDKSIDMLSATDTAFDLPYDIITNYSEIKILKNLNGKIIKKDNDLSKVYNVPLEESKDLIRQWAEKYLDLTSDLCKLGTFIPTITGGCDTRVLTYFWRKHNLDKYHLHAVKKSGNDTVENGKIEIGISQKVLNRLGMNCERLEEIPFGEITLNGVYTETNCKSALHNNVLFIKNVINRCISTHSKHICPFVDDLYLMIKSNELYDLRVLFMLIFCPDLLDIELKSSSNKGIYTFNYFKDTIVKMEELLNKWNFRM